MEDPGRKGKNGLVVLAMVAIVAIGLYALFKPLFLHFAAQELTESDNGKNALRFAASAAPLVCSLALSEKEKRSFELLSEAVSLVNDKAEECGGSLAKVSRCLKRYSAELEESVLGDIAVEPEQDLLGGAVDSVERLWNRGKRTVEKARALYAAEVHMRRSLRRAIQRAEMIETFGQWDDEVKDSILELLNYVDGVGIGDLLKDPDSVRSETRRRVNAAKAAIAAWVEKSGERFPIAALYLLVNVDVEGLFGKPEVSSTVNSSPVWEAGFNKFCNPKGVLEALPGALRFATALAEKFANR